MEDSIPLIGSLARNHQSSGTAKACPQCGKPIDVTNFTQKNKETVSEVPKKVIEREGHNSRYQKAVEQRYFSTFGHPLLFINFLCLMS